jgi:hypothetical protein
MTGPDNFLSPPPSPRRIRHVIPWRLVQIPRKPSTHRRHVCSLTLTCVSENHVAVPWLRLLVADHTPRRAGFDHRSVPVGFVVDKVILGQGFPRLLRFCPANFIPPVLQYTEKFFKKLIILTTGLHNKPGGCGAPAGSAAGPFTTHKKKSEENTTKELKLYSNQATRWLSKEPRLDFPYERTTLLLFHANGSALRPTIKRVRGRFPSE